MSQGQNYENHIRIHPPFHYCFVGITFLTLLGSFVNFYQSLGDHQRMYSASLICVICFLLFSAGTFARLYALKAQDRAIRAEENLRHFILSGKLLPGSLTLAQIVALRFAPDEELLELAQRAVSDRMKPSEIKRAIRTWRADYDRV